MVGTRGKKIDVVGMLRGTPDRKKKGTPDAKSPDPKSPVICKKTPGTHCSILPEDEATPSKRSRGRPRKVIPECIVEDDSIRLKHVAVNEKIVLKSPKGEAVKSESLAGIKQNTVHRHRGRPRKSVPVDSTDDTNDEDESEEKREEKPDLKSTRSRRSKSKVCHSPKEHLYSKSDEEEIVSKPILNHHEDKEKKEDTVVKPEKVHKTSKILNNIASKTMQTRETSSKTAQSNMKVGLKSVINDHNDSGEHGTTTPIKMNANKSSEKGNINTNDEKFSEEITSTLVGRPRRSIPVKAGLKTFIKFEGLKEGKKQNATKYPDSDDDRESVDKAETDRTRSGIPENMKESSAKSYPKTLLKSGRGPETTPILKKGSTFSNAFSTFLQKQADEEREDDSKKDNWISILKDSDDKSTSNMQEKNLISPQTSPPHKKHKTDSGTGTRSSEKTVSLNLHCKSHIPSEVPGVNLRWSQTTFDSRTASEASANGKKVEETGVKHEDTIPDVDQILDEVNDIPENVETVQFEYMQTADVSVTSDAVNKNEVIIVIPADIPESDVPQFIADNVTQMPESYIVRREAVPEKSDMEDMNSLDVLVQMAVNDSTRTPNTQSNMEAFHKMPVYFPHLSITKGLAPLVCDLPGCMCTYYHCKLCRPELVGAFTKSVMRVHYDHHRKKGIQFGDYDIYTCHLACNPDPHLHCPLCGSTVASIDKSLSSFLAHLGTCLQTEQMDQKDSKTMNTNAATKSENKCIQPPSSVLVPHPSIIRVEDKLEAELCTPGNGCGCGYYHCPLCSIHKQQFKYYCQAAKHFVYHMKHCVVFNGSKMMICALSCRVFSHYHCSLCGNTFQRKCDLQKHVTTKCKGPAKKRKKKAVEISSNLYKTYSEVHNSTSFFQRIKSDESRNVIKMCKENTRMIDFSQIPCPHLSIIHKDSTIHPTLCNGKHDTCNCGNPFCLLCAEKDLWNCKCRNYHCILCPPSKLSADKIQRARDHIHAHYKKGIPFKDHIVLSCGMLSCVPEKKHGYHFHCPLCGVITFLIECFRRHLYSGCQVKDTFFRFVERDDVKNASINTKIAEADDHQLNVACFPAKVSTPASHNSATAEQYVEETNEEVPHCTIKQEFDADLQDTPQSALDLALPYSANVKVKENETPVKASQVLRCVSADLQVDLLQQACPSDPEVLLQMLQQHVGVTVIRGADKGVYRVQGSWEMLENASSIILKLIELKFSTPEDVLNFIVKNTSHQKVEPEPALEPEWEEIATEIAPAETNNEEETYMDQPFWTEVNNLEKYLEAGANKKMLLPVRCLHCRKRLVSMNNLIIHWKAKPICLENLQDDAPAAYFTVKDAIETIVKPVCVSCNKTFTSLVSCINHYIRKVCRRDDHHDRMMTFGIFKDRVSSVYCCPLCAYTSVGKRHAVSHYEKKHLPKVHACTYDNCKMSFATTEALERHIDVIHVNPLRNKVPCDVCGLPLKRTSVNYHMLSKHATEVSSMPVMNCEHCDYTSWSCTNLRMHMANIHSEKKFVCDICGRSFGRIVLLTQHKKHVHDKVARYRAKNDRLMAQCEVCNAVMFKKNLTRHMQSTHNEDKQFPCHGCEKVFFNKRARWLHNLCHLTNSQNERVYLFKCSICQKGFNRRWWYIEHVQNAHTDAKPYECNECGKKFRFKLLYKKHMAVHMTPDTQCKLCKKVFASMWSLRVHMATKHAEQGGVACVCGAKFVSLQSYREHRQACRLLDSDKEDVRLIMPDTEVLSDGIQYETTILDLNALTQEEQSDMQNVAVEHLEAAQTLESISDAGQVVSSVVTIHPNDALSSNEKHVLVYTEDGNLVSLDTSQMDAEQINQVFDADGMSRVSHEEQITGDVQVVEEEPESRTIVMETDENGRVILKTADGQLLSDEESQQILMEMNGDPELELASEPTTEPADAVLEEMTQGYMCDICSVVYSSLHMMEQHIQENHANNSTVITVQ